LAAAQGRRRNLGSVLGAGGARGRAVHRGPPHVRLRARRLQLLLLPPHHPVHAVGALAGERLVVAQLRLRPGGAQEGGVFGAFLVAEGEFVRRGVRARRRQRLLRAGQGVHLMRDGDVQLREQSVARVAARVRVRVSVLVVGGRRAEARGAVNGVRPFLFSNLSVLVLWR